jgi:hypothetical protein
LPSRTQGHERFGPVLVEPCPIGQALGMAQACRRILKIHEFLPRIGGNDTDHLPDLDQVETDAHLRNPSPAARSRPSSEARWPMRGDSAARSTIRLFHASGQASRPAASRARSPQFRRRIRWTAASAPITRNKPVVTIAAAAPINCAMLLLMKRAKSASSASVSASAPQKPTTSHRYIDRRIAKENAHDQQSRRQREHQPSNVVTWGRIPNR